METNDFNYREEIERLNTQLKLVNQHLKTLKEVNLEQQEMLEECWERIYYKRAWLTLSDNNIKGMRKHIEELKKTEKYKKLMMEE